MSIESLFNWPEPTGDVMLSERIRLWRDRAKLAAQVAERAHGELAKVTTALGYSAGEISIDQVVEHVRNVKALADKLQTLLDSKTHQVEAMRNEMEKHHRAHDLLFGAQERMAKRAADTDSMLDEVLKVLRPHAVFLVAEDGSPVDIARNVVEQIASPVPDMDTVPLADLLEAVGTYLEPDQAVTIRGSYEPTRQVELHALGLTFGVDTHEASEALTKLQELGMCLMQDPAR